MYVGVIIIVLLLFVAKFSSRVSRKCNCGKWEVLLVQPVSGYIWHTVNCICTLRAAGRRAVGACHCALGHH